MDTRGTGRAATRYSEIDEPGCRAFQDSLELVGRRWTGAVLLAAIRGARRFGEYRAAVSGISDRLLAQRLKELEADGLIERTVIPSTPVKIRYAPTPDGEALMSVLQPLINWSHQRRTRNQPGQHAPLVKD